MLLCNICRQLFLGHMVESANKKEGENASNDNMFYDI